MEQSNSDAKIREQQNQIIGLTNVSCDACLGAEDAMCGITELGHGAART